MQITRIEISGFGNFSRPVDFEFKPGELGLVFGRNEAGKSTIIGALFAALYGLKPTEKKLYRSWENEEDYRVRLFFEQDKKQFLIDRDLDKNFVRISELGNSERILFKDYHLPSEKFDRIYFEAFRQIFPLPPRDILMATSVIHEHQVRVDVDAGLRQLITGTRETDYEDVLGALEDEYYRLTRDRLPWQKYGGPRTDQLLEKKNKSIQELEIRIEDESSYFNSQREIQQNLLEAESRRKKREVQIPSLQRLLVELRKMKQIRDSKNQLQSKKTEILARLEQVESIMHKKEVLQVQNSNSYPHLAAYDPSELQRESSAFLPLRKRKLEIESRLSTLESEISGLQEELKDVPDFSDAPQNFLYIVEEIRKMDSKIPHYQDEEKEKGNVTDSLSKRFRGRLFLDLTLLIIFISSGLATYFISPLSILGWAGSVLFLFATIIVFSVEVFPVRKKLKNARQEWRNSHIILKQFQESRNLNFNSIKDYIGDNLEHTMLEYRKFVTNRKRQEDVALLMNSLREDLKAIVDDPQYCQYAENLEKLVKKNGSVLMEEIAQYQKNCSQLEAYAQQLAALPSHESLLELKEKLMQQISNLEYSRDQLIAELPRLEKLLEKNEPEVLIDKIENDINNAFNEKNELDSQIATYRAQAQQTTTVSYNPEQLKEEKEDLEKAVAYLGIRRDALVLALDTLRSSVQEFRNAHLQAINSGIQKHLERMISPMNFQVNLDPDFRIQLGYKGRPIQLNQLSSGTHDQLFFAYRLVLSELLSPQIPFPFIVDDAFVQFDPSRTERIFATLRDLKKNHQVIVCASNPKYIDYCDYVVDLDHIAT